MSWWLSIIACMTVEESAPAGPSWWFPPPMGLVPLRAEPPAIAAFAEPKGTVNLIVRFSTEDPISRWMTVFTSEPTLTERSSASERSSAGVHPEGLERERVSTERSSAEVHPEGLDREPENPERSSAEVHPEGLDREPENPERSSAEVHPEGLERELENPERSSAEVHPSGRAPSASEWASAGVHPEGLAHEKANTEGLERELENTEGLERELENTEKVNTSHRVTLTGSTLLDQPYRIEGAILPVVGGAYVFEAMGPPDVFGWVDNALDTLIITAGPPLSPEAWATACSDPCMGLRSVEIWRAPDRSIGRVHTRGDLSKCSHVMSTWRDADGAELLSVSDKPVSAERATEIRRQVDAIVVEHTLAGTLDCPPPE